MGEIVASLLTGNDVDNAGRVPDLLGQIEGEITSVTVDGAYDQAGVYASVAERYPKAAVIIPPSETAEIEPTPRDRHLERIAARGRMGWQKLSGYTKRARAEAAIARWKQVIGDGLRSRTDERRATKMAIATHALNRMLELGRPNYVRVA